MLSKLDTLFDERYHGAGNHRGVLYHALYGSQLGLSLDAESGQRLNTERYEDLELVESDGSLVLYQLKCYSKKLGFGDLEEVFRSFAKVIREKTVSSCWIVTSTGYDKEIENWMAEPKKRSMPSKLKDRIKKVAAGDKRVLDTLTNCLQLLVVTSDEICEAVSQKIVLTTGITQATHESFLHALAFQMAEWSGKRSQVTHAMIANVLLEVQTQFEAGLRNPAVEQGLIVPVLFNLADSFAEDFYEGRAARAGHIAAGKDVLRAKALSDVKRAFAEANVVSIISSSGQGKSALALRHLANHTTGDFVYEIKACRRSEDAAAIVAFVRFRLKLGLGVSLLIDNLSRSQFAWIELAAALAGENVKIVLTAREEDWKLFAGDLSQVNWKRVTPSLELDEARQIFQNLRSARKIHPSLRSADEAYAKVSEAKLLIEYVYLLTQGELLEDRLNAQIGDLEGRDSGAIDCLQLVSLADQMNLRIEASRLLESVEFQGNAQRALSRLDGEYLVIQDGVCSGLHPVRSQHLVKLLHPYGIESTLRGLLGLVEDVELPEFTFSLLARTDANYEKVVDTLAERTKRAGDFTAVWEAAYAGSEVRYAKSCKPQLDLVEEKVGRAGVNLFPLLTPPFFGSLETLEVMRGILDQERFESLKRATEDIPQRQYTSRLETLLAEDCANNSGVDDGLDARLSQAKAFWLSGDHQKGVDILRELDWVNTLLTLPLNLAIRMAFLAQEMEGERYTEFAQERLDAIVAYLLKATHSLEIRTEDKTLVVSFIVDPYSEHRDNDQAVSRVLATKGLLPGYERYATDPVRPMKLPLPLPHDDAHKDGPSENWYPEEVISLNKKWTEAMEIVTASDSLVGWEWTQRESFLIAATVLADFADFIGKQDASREIGQGDLADCGRRLNAFHDSREARRKLPSTLDEHQKAKASYVDKLSAALDPLLERALDELLRKDEGEIDRLHLILFLIRDVHFAANMALESLDWIRERAGLDRGRDFAKKIRSDAERLYRSVERRSQSKHGLTRLDSLSTSTSRFLQRVLEDQDTGLARRIRLADKALLYTPGAEKEHFRLPSWFFTLEVTQLENFVAEALTVCSLLALAFDSFIGNFIAVPVLHGTRISQRVYRGMGPALREFAANPQFETPVIWPIDDVGEIPNEIFGIKSHKDRSQLDLIQPFVEVGERLAYSKAASFIELAHPGADQTFTERLVNESLSEKFSSVLARLEAYQELPELSDEWEAVLKALRENALVIGTAPDEFVFKNGLLSAPLDKYLESSLTLEAETQMAAALSPSRGEVELGL